MSDPQQFFTREAIAHARRLPLPEAVTYLRGLMESLGDDEVTSPVQRIYMLLTESDRQLELFQTGQLKLNLQPKGDRS